MLSEEPVKPIDQQVVEDHTEVRHCYQQFKDTGEMQFYNQLVFELCRHSVAEELILYPLLDSLGNEGKQLADEARQDHQVLKESLVRLEDLSKRAPFENFVQELDNTMKVFFCHLEKEEGTDLPMIVDQVSEEDRIDKGRAFSNRKKMAPTHPHPGIPTTPVTLEAAMGMLQAPIDSFRDLFRSFPSK